MSSNEARDREDYDLLWRTHHAELARTCRYLAGGGQPDDLIQETLARAWKKRIATKLDPEHHLRWLRATARNVAYESWRESKKSIPVSNEEFAHRPADETPGGEVVYRVDIYAVVHELRPNDREVLLLKFKEAHTDQEIAAQLGIGIGTMKVRRHRAMKRLRARLRRRHGIKTYDDCLKLDGKEMSNA